MLLWLYSCRATNLTKADECRQSIYSLINSYILKPSEGINLLYCTVTCKLNGILLTIEWQMLLDLIQETIEVCPETFILHIQHSNSPKLSKHGIYKYSRQINDRKCVHATRV